MEDKQRKSVLNAFKIKKDYGLSDEDMDQFVVPEMMKRDKSYRRKVISRYGKDVYVKASKWWQNLSPRDQKLTGADNPEEIVQTYLANNPKEVSSSDLAKGVGKDERRRQIHDSRFDELPPPIINEEGRIVGGKKLTVARKPPRQPTPKELSKMSQKEIADLIKQTRDYYWPSGESGDMSIDGVQGSDEA